jgi:hypothetical protein|tara:strand:- start:89 stop:322 length:234 start_codon:yes stop_codon:yes gene_type:complete
MNMKLIDPTDPLYFNQTSDLPYDRHQYEFVYSNGQHLIFDSWEDVRGEWFNMPSRFKSHINVLDIKQKKKKTTKGFK